MNDDDDDMIVIIKLSLKQDTPYQAYLLYLATGQSSSTQLKEEEEEEEDGEGKGRESVVHVVIYEKRRSFSAFPFVSGIRMMN